MICVKLRNNICVNTNGYFKGRLIFPEYALAVWHALWSLCTVPEWRYWDRSLLGCKVFGLYIVQCSCQKLLYNLHCHSAIEKKINAYIDKNFTADAQTSRVFLNGFLRLVEKLAPTKIHIGCSSCAGWPGTDVMIF
jgi:hypothetical protein